MQQYFEGKSKKNIKQVVSAKTQSTNLGRVYLKDILFVNERIDTYKIDSCVILHSTFANMGFKNTSFIRNDFSHCTFIDCYFKSSSIIQNNFTGCRFINCTFDGPLLVISDCVFKYATFDGCYIPFEIMKSNLPENEENLCADLCRNLSLQCLALGEISDYSKYYFKQRHAEETHEIRKLIHVSGSYYDKKYNFFEGIAGLFNFLRSKMSRYLWGYGEKISPLLLNILIIIALYSLIYFFVLTPIGYDMAISVSICSFFNISSFAQFDYEKINALIISEGIVGLLFTGLLVTAIFRRINRR